MPVANIISLNLCYMTDMQRFRTFIPTDQKIELFYPNSQQVCQNESQHIPVYYEYSPYEVSG